MRNRFQKPQRSEKAGGFALIVTLSLMAFLVLIAVGMLSLASTTMRQAGASEAMAVARNNARLALQLALGELQIQAGPDQRVTGVADLAGTSTGASLNANDSPQNSQSVNHVGNGLTPVQPGTRYWTGVWERHVDDPDTDHATREILTSTPSPILRQWLVSGNESLGPLDRITPDVGAYAVNPDGTASAGGHAVVLVGAGTVGKPSAENLDRYVVVPLVASKGRDGSSGGRYGWWIGDEGVKARINLVLPPSVDSSYVSLPTRRHGWEIVEGFSTFPTPDSPLQSGLPKVITLAQTGLLIPAAVQTTGDATPLQAVFHSATTDSMAVIADTLGGGTRIDLSAILASDLPVSKPVSAASVANYPVKDGRIIPSGPGYPWGSGMQAPRWDAIKEFHDRFAELENGALIVKPGADKTLPSTAPLVTDFRIIMGAKLVPRGGPDNAATATDFQVHPCAKIAIAIANPYAVPLQWKQDLEFRISNQTPNGNLPSRFYINNRPAPSGKGSFLPSVPNRDVATGAEPSVFHEAVFRIPPGSLPPGEARAFTMAAPVVRPAGSITRVDITLVPFASSDPGNFENCVELEVNEADARTPTIRMDIRESWQTTRAMLEMRLAGAGVYAEPLLRLESFEIDSAFDFQKGTRIFADADACRRMTKPFAMQLFNFQISQPGADYASIFGGAPYFAMGQRSSTMRTFADFNLAATRFTNPITSYNPPPYFAETSDSEAALPRAEPGGETGPKFTSNLLSNPLNWGRGPSGVNRTILFTAPRTITSLAQLQHADLTGDNDHASVGHQPGNAFGNSHAPPFVKRDLTSEIRTNYVVIGSPNRTGARQEPKPFYDISYLLNAAIWDTYFLSTIAKDSATPEIPIIFRLRGDAPPAELQDPMLAASHLMIHGGFNVNSTDQNAWKAFLASARHFSHPADSNATADAAFPRSLEQTSPAAAAPTGTAADSFSGFRRLSDDQLDSLATEITRQVRLRGPFLSLSHFVNRVLAPLDSSTRALSRSGALQLALDESGANINLEGDKSVFSGAGFSPAADKVTLQVKDGMPRADFDGQAEVVFRRSFRPEDADSTMPDWGSTSGGLHYGSVASIISDREILNNDEFRSEQGYRSTGIPGWLTQADVLQVIGPAISARSDTFRIRTYGEAVDGRGKTIAKAYCEAIVQRIPDYVDPANSPSDRDDPSSDGVGVLSDVNKTHGRQFRIISFRWLSPPEI